MKEVNWQKFRGINGNSRRIKALHGRLDKIYGPFVPKKRHEPLDELILTVLSQHTSDLNSDRAFENLKKTFPNWRDILRARTDEIERAIRVGGLAKNKAKSIKAIVERLHEKNEKMDLSHFAKMPVSEAVEELTSYPGIGLKTASCVLLFSFGRPSMPVDTHVHRVSTRLGLVKEKSLADKLLCPMAITSEELVYPFHMYLIRHGRQVCVARNPRCPECVLNDICPSATL